MSASAERRERWIKWLQVVLVMLAAYSLLLVAAGDAARSLFAALGFGPPTSIDSDELRDYLRLPFMVLGAVLAGWCLLMIEVVRGPLRAGAPWALPAMVRSLVLWFVLDTSMSLMLGFPAHALFNVPFAVALGIPLSRLASARRRDRMITH